MREDDCDRDTGHVLARRRQRRGSILRLWRRLARHLLPGAPPRPGGRAGCLLAMSKGGPALATAVLALVLASGLPAGCQDTIGPDIPHVRGSDRRARAVLDIATRLSPTVAWQIAELQKTDLIVIVEVGYLNAMNGLAYLFAASPTARYVRVRLRIPNDDLALVRTLAHELQHALEIAALPEIRDSRSMARAYDRIGFPHARHGRYETQAALRVGALVARELKGQESRGKEQ